MLRHSWPRILSQFLLLPLQSTLSCFPTPTLCPLAFDSIIKLG